MPESEAPKPRSLKDTLALIGSALLASALLMTGMGIYAEKCEKRPGDEPQSSAVVATEPAPKRECKVAHPGKPGSVVVFPTEQGFAEAIQAAADGDERAYKTALLANAAFAVPSGTPCALLERKRGRAKIRLLDDAHALQVVFLPIEQTGME
ncbi:MAG TPA: hypothetical protein VG734_25530 [Lacunisphaera sp.]|nr:hypothetical protein [Lacunisphaera sp.]